MNENVFSSQELAGDFHQTHVWGRKLYKMFKEGRLEIVPTSNKQPDDRDYGVMYRHLQSGLYLKYFAHFVRKKEGFQESVVLCHPVTTKENVRVFHSDDFEDLERMLDL